MIAISLAWLTLCSNALADVESLQEWSPDAVRVSHIDSLALRFKLPKADGALGDYSRYYYGVIEGGRKFVTGIFFSPHEARNIFHETKPGQIHISSEKLLPRVMGGGCGIVWVRLDVKSGKLSEDCNSSK
jgi:hypothetical protein